MPAIGRKRARYDEFEDGNKNESKEQRGDKDSPYKNVLDLISESSFTDTQYQEVIQLCQKKLNGSKSNKYLKSLTTYLQKFTPDLITSIKLPEKQLLVLREEIQEFVNKLKFTEAEYTETSGRHHDVEYRLKCSYGIDHTFELTFSITEEDYDFHPFTKLVIIQPDNEEWEDFEGIESLCNFKHFRGTMLNDFWNLIFGAAFKNWDGEWNLDTAEE